MKLIVQLNAIRTTIDGGWRITFDCDQSQSDLITKLAQLRDVNIELTVDFEKEPIFPSDSYDG